MTVDTTVAPQPRPWGIIMTVLWIVLAVIVMMIATLGAIFVFFPEGAIDAPAFDKDARAFGILSLVAAASAVAVLVVAAKLAGWRVSDYLALVPPDRGDAIKATVALVVFVMALRRDHLSDRQGHRHPVPDRPLQERRHLELAAHHVGRAGDRGAGRRRDRVPRLPLSRMGADAALGVAGDRRHLRASGRSSTRSTTGSACSRSS